MEWDCFPTKFGFMALVKTDRGISQLILPEKNKSTILERIKEIANGKGKEKPLPWRKELQDYFAGKIVEFICQLDLTGFTPFEREVFCVARTIPYGRTRSYRWIAAKVGSPKAWQAVGQALRKNTLPIIIPCHRVIMTNGNVGGFSFGLEWKTRLLELEKIILT